ncbi:uncharacterized protein TNCV_2033551 [Trichonephila clavipes]|nr:uncharacterized protein TNCV_2033551 [Trichonephila clavipes]
MTSFTLHEVSQICQCKISSDFRAENQVISDHLAIRISLKADNVIGQLFRRLVIKRSVGLAQEIPQGLHTSTDEIKTPEKTGESLQEYASEVERLANLAFSDQPATMREVISLQYFVDGLNDGEIQKAVRMTDVQDLKSALLYALKLEAANEASSRDRNSIRIASVTADAPCESPWRKDIKKLKEEIQYLMAQLQNRRRRSITCWGCGESRHLRSNCPRNNKKDLSTKFWECGGAGRLRNNYPRVNQEHPHRANVIESKKVCRNQKGSAKKNGDIPSRRSCPENNKYCSRTEKKFGVIDPTVRQVTTQSASESDPWSYESV